MPNFPRPLPDVPAKLIGFTIAAAVLDEADALNVSLLFSVSVISAAGHTHQLNGDLAQFLTPAQATTLTNAALTLYTKAKNDLL